MLFLTKIILFSLSFQFIILFWTPFCWAENTQTLIRRLTEKSQRDQESLRRVRDYQKTQERIIDHQRIQNQKNITDATRKLQDQNRIQRARLDELKRKMDNLKRQQSYYSRVKIKNPLRHQFSNMRHP